LEQKGELTMQIFNTLTRQKEEFVRRRRAARDGQCFK
jgi:hypothetical protein